MCENEEGTEPKSGTNWAQLPTCGSPHAFTRLPAVPPAGGCRLKSGLRRAFEQESGGRKAALRRSAPSPRPRLLKSLPSGQRSRGNNSEPGPARHTVVLKCSRCWGRGPKVGRDVTAGGGRTPPVSVGRRRTSLFPPRAGGRHVQHPVTGKRPWSWSGRQRPACWSPLSSLRPPGFYSRIAGEGSELEMLWNHLCFWYV